MAPTALDSSASVFTSSLEGGYLTTSSALLRNGLKQWRSLKPPTRSPGAIVSALGRLGLLASELPSPAKSFFISVSSKKLKLIYDRRLVGQSVLVSGSYLEPMTRFLFSVWRLRVSWYVVPSLTRGWVCNLLVQLLLGLARAVTLGSKSLRTHDHILLSRLRFPQPGGPGPRIYSPQEQGGPVIPPGTGFSFVASYDSQGNGGGILTRLHTGLMCLL
jgi:hypothetical protein